MESKENRGWERRELQNTQNPFPLCQTLKGGGNPKNGKKEVKKEKTFNGRKGFSNFVRGKDRWFVKPEVYKIGKRREIAVRQHVLEGGVGPRIRGLGLERRGLGKS